MAGTLLVALMVLLGLILLSIWIVLYQLIKQQGRILLRLDDVKHRFAHGTRGVVTTGLALNGVPGRSQTMIASNSAN